MIKVKELIEHLKTFDENLPVAYRLHSEYDEMALDHIIVEELSGNRGYLTTPYTNIQTLLKTKYLVFPGN